MPIAYTFLNSPGVHLVSYQGVVTNQDFLDSYKAASIDPRYRPGMVEISDLRHAEAIDIDFDTMREFVDWVAGRNDLSGTTLRCGILLDNEAHAGLSRLYEAVADLHTTETIRRFRDLPTLLAWLHVDAEQTATVEDALADLVQDADGALANPSAKSRRIEN